MIKSLVRRKIFEPFFVHKNRSIKLKYWRELERTQYLPEEVLMQKQWERVNEILRFAYNKNSFYKDRFDKVGIKPEDIKTKDDFMKLPVLTKEEIRQNTQAMISKGFDTKSLLKFKTGGSTGKSLELYITEECSEMRNACARRHDRWAGWEVGEPIGAIWGNPVLPKDLKSKLRDRLLQPFIFLDTMQVSDKAVIAFAKQWRKTKPTLLFGHAHSIFILAEYIKKLDISDSRPRGIISSSMMLLPHERAVIEAVFGIKVTDRYGCEEVSLIASQCEMHEGMHINIEHLYVEFLKEDGTYTKSGEQGKIIVTDLMNRAMPFIRYQVEDIGVPVNRKCSCGRGLPLTEKIVGRVADFLIKSDGAKVAGISLIENTLTKIPGIKQMQIVQKEIDEIILNIVPDSNFTTENESKLINYFKELFGSDIILRLRKIPEIKPETNGKYRFSKCGINSFGNINYGIN